VSSEEVRADWAPRPAGPRVEFEITTLTGDAGRQLAVQQAAAIRAVLAWLARNPASPSTAEDD
jgi:hypothetical protein